MRHILGNQLNNQLNLQQVQKPEPEEESKLVHYGDFPDHYNLTGEEETFIWKFRYWLLHQSQNPAAGGKMLLRFLQSVQWKNQAQAEEGLAIMEQWQHCTY